MVKHTLKILIIGLIIFALILSALSLFLALKGKSIIISRLEEATKRKVTLRDLDLSPALNLNITGLDIEGLAKIDSLFISPSLLGLLTGKIAFNEIRVTRPEFTYERIVPQTERITRKELSLRGADIEKRKFLPLVLKRLVIKDATLNIIDHTVGADGIKVTIKDLDFYLDNLFLLPKSVITNFQLKGKIPWQNKRQVGEVAASGWINLFKKDMQAALEIKDIDGVSLYPYYAKWVNLEKSRIKQASLQFKSDITGHNNDIVANCHLELTDIVFRETAEGEEEDRAFKIATAVLDIFRVLNKGKISLNFTIRTKMDRPEFGFNNVRQAFEEQLAQGAKSDKVSPQTLLLLPVNLLNGAIKSATDITRTLIKSTVEVGKTIKDVVVDPFKKDTKEKKDKEE